MKRDLISLENFSTEEIQALLDSAATLKKGEIKTPPPLNGKSIGLIFQKPSNRTRVSFEVGVYQLGGNCLYLGPQEINLGKRESTSDVAKTLSRYLDGLVARTFLHSDVIELGKESSVPVINGLSDLYHPCQALADIFSIQEKFEKIQGLTLAYVGDGNNVCHSLLLACAKVGVNVNVATPKGYEPSQEILNMAKSFCAQTGAQIQTTNSPVEGVKGANVIYADVWVSMGQETESNERLNTFKDFQINAELLQNADKNYIFMHCLPAHRGQEVTAEIIDGEHSIVFDQAENRMHIQKAILSFLVGSA